MDCIFIISQENPPLAVAEIEGLLGTRAKRVRDDAVRAQVHEPELLSRLAFTRSASVIVAAANEAELSVALSSAHERLAKLHGTYRVTLHGRAQTTLRERDLAAMLAPHLNAMHVDIAQPETTFDMIATPEGTIYACVRLSTIQEDWNSRKAHKRPALHPSGMHPKLARCLVNLSGARREILDPMCGTGGILIEAGLMGLRARGSDIDKRLLSGARENLGAYGVTGYDLEERDALSLAKTHVRAEAIVSDLPYGRHSSAPKSLEGFYEAALVAFASVTDRAVIMMPDDVAAQAIIAKTPWHIERTFSWYTHASLTRMIFLLGKEK